MRYRNDAVAALAAAVLLVGLIVAALLAGCGRESTAALACDDVIRTTCTDLRLDHPPSCADPIAGTRSVGVYPVAGRTEGSPVCASGAGRRVSREGLA